MRSKFTILPKRLDQMVKQNIESKKIQNVATGFLFAAFLCLLIMFTPVFASLGSFFGYPDSTIGVYSEILSGKSAMTTLDQVFSAGVFNSIQSMPVLNSIIHAASILGIAFVMLYVGLGIIEAVQHGQMTNERLAALLITFAIPAFFIINFNMLKNVVTTAGTATKDSVVQAVKSSDDYYKDDTVPLLSDYLPSGDYSITDMIEALSAWGEEFAKRNEVRIHVVNVVSGMKIFDFKAKSLGDRWSDVTDEAIQRWDEIADSGDAWYEKAADGIANIGKTAWGYASSIFSSAGDKIAEALNELMQKISDFILTFILICVDIGVRLGIMLSCYGVIGRMVIYQCFLPMSIADVGREGARSNGMRMIKLYFATFLEIGLFYLINLLGWKIFSILILQQETVVGLIVCFIGAGAGIRALMKGAKDVSERLVGANG